MPAGQLPVVRQLCHGEEKALFRAKVIEMHGRVVEMPKVYEQDGKGMNATAYLHYMKGLCRF